MKNKSTKLDVTDKTQKIHNHESWSAALDSIFINDDRWWCIITMMVETIVEESRYASLFNEAVERKKETCLYALSYRKAIATVKTLSRQDSKKCPAVQGVCHYTSMILSENNGDLSTWLVARVIKYLIYRAKLESQSVIKPRKVDSGEGEHAFNDRANTRLRERDEERRDFVRTDDASSSKEPNLYVILSGFYDPDLPAELQNVGAPLTCILEIKSSPDERNIAYYEEAEEGLMLQKESYSFGDYCISENDLFEFWTVTHERFANPLAYPVYSDIAILPVCPPETSVATEKESLMRDMYDRTYLALRHLYNLHRWHANYLKSMRLEEAIVDARDETVDTRNYEDALSDIPNEYISVPLILGAILLQIESNFSPKPLDEYPLVDRTAEFNDTRYEDTSMMPERASVCTVQDKLKLLDLKYEFCDEYVDSAANLSSQLPDIRLVPYADTLNEITCRFLDHKSVDLIDTTLRILRNPRIINIWRDHEELTDSKVNMYFCHMDNIARSCDRTVSREEITHYLHLLTFDKLICSENTREEERRSTRRAPISELSRAKKYVRPTLRGTYSASNLTSASTGTSNLCRSRSDSEINYGEPVTSLTECWPLFALTDTRETLLPGYLSSKRVLEKERPTAEEYEDVELLSDRAFLQVAYECLQSFDRFEARYFEPTDSVLLYFSNEADGAVSEETRSSSIRTPVRLGDFSKYIVHEEKNWIEREGRTESNRADLTGGRFMKRSVEMEDDAIIFDNERFVLSDSLKARHLKASLDRDTREKIFEETKKFEGTSDVKKNKTSRQKRNEAAVEAANGESERANGRVMSGGTRVSMTEKKLDSTIDDVDTPFLPVKKIPSSRCAEEGESYDFVGYDLGNVRVQVTHRGKKFLLRDDTSVRVELEDWLYGDLDLRIAVTLRDYTLRLSSAGIGCRRFADTFHLTTKRGIVLGFCRNKESGK